MSGYVIRRAAAVDLDDMIALRVEAEKWLQANGIRQWTPDYDQYARGVLARSVQAGVAWIISEGATGPVVGTVSINGPDPDFWDPPDDPDAGLYLGKMIVSRTHAGEHLGDAIMNWASRRAVQLGKRWLRLDCRRDNSQLQAYYLARGFEHVRTVEPPRRRTESGWLGQRVAGVECNRERAPELGER